jgi:hypothetical protein
MKASAGFLLVENYSSIFINHTKCDKTKFKKSIVLTEMEDTGSQVLLFTDE